MATAQPSRPSTLKRYLPAVAAVAVIAIVVAIVAVVSSGDDEEPTTTDTTTPKVDIPISFDAAEEAGTVDDYDWGENCDTDSGRVALPSKQAPMCVPAWDGGDNGGATSKGVTADTIRIGLYRTQPDPQLRAMLEAAGAYDDPDVVNETRKSYLAMFESLMQTYGRKLEFVTIEGTGASDDPEAARADAIKAADEDVFAVLGGPLQTKVFSEELAKRGVLCIGTCLLAQPEPFYDKYADFIYPNGPSPEQSYRHTTEMIAKQLLGKKATFAGDPELRDQTRRFALVAYDSPDGQFAESRATFEKELEDNGIELVDTVTYYLDIAKAAADARTIVTKLKASGATSVIFTGDPILPIFFTKEATTQGYRPEWILSGTVFADTTTLGRLVDQDQWAHAISYTYLSARIAQMETDAYVSHEWWYGVEPAASNAYAIIFADTQLLVSGIHAAGPKLSPQTFHAGIYENSPVVAPEPDILTQVNDWDDEGGLWERPDHNGVDNATLLWWDSEVVGPDETGNVGKGMWRFVDGGKRYLPGGWPTEPLPLFDPEDTITIYDEAPEGLKPPEYPTNPNAPVAKTSTSSP